MVRLIQKLFVSLGKITVPAILKTLLVLFFVTAAYQSYAIYHALESNRLLAKGISADRDQDLEPRLLLAKAWQLEEAGRFDEALQVYNTIEKSAAAYLKETATYNASTLLLKRAAKHWNESGVLAYAEVDPLVNLAEEGFRKVLRQNPDNWNARYNLEYTLRIHPPRKEIEKSDWEGQKSSVYAILPGIPREGP